MAAAYHGLVTIAQECRSFLAMEGLISRGRRFCFCFPELAPPKSPWGRANINMLNCREAEQILGAFSY